MVTEADVDNCLVALKVARTTGDKLKIALAQAAFDDALDRWMAQSHVTPVTRNERSSRAPSSSDSLR